MDAELAVNMFSEQFYGRILEDLQDEDQSLPNIPIADLGDLDINISTPQNGGLHWTNNNNNNDMLTEADNTWAAAKPQFETGMKRPLDNSGDIHDGQKGTKYLRSLLASDVTSLDNGDDSLGMFNGGTNLTLISSHSDRQENGLNIALGDDNAAGDPPTVMGSFEEAYASAERGASSADSCGFIQGPLHAEKNHESQSNVEKTESRNANMDTYQQVYQSPATVTTYGRRVNECDNKGDSLPPVIESMGRQKLPGGTSESSRPDSHPHGGESINVVKEEQPSLKEQQEQNEEIKTQTFLDWAMENLLKSADTLLEIQSEKDENVSTKSASKHGDTACSDQGQPSYDEGANESAQEKDNSSADDDNQKETVSTPPIQIQKCIMCLLCFKNNEDLLAHLKRSHSEVDCFQCPQCAAKLDDLELLEDHMKVHSLISNISTDDPQLETSAVHVICEICHALFLSSEALREHHSTFHEEVQDEPEDCSLPENDFSTEPNHAHKLTTTTEAIIAVPCPDGVNHDNCGELNESLAQLEELPNAANTTTQLKHSDLQVNSEQDLQYDSKREPLDMTEIESGKNTSNSKNQDMKFNSASDNGLIALSQNLDHNNVDDLHTRSEQGYTNNPHLALSQDCADRSRGLFTSFGPESDKNQTENKSKTYKEQSVENKDHTFTSQQDTSVHKLGEVSTEENLHVCDGDIGKKTVVTRHTNDLITDQNGVSLSENLSNFKHDNGLVLLCNRESNEPELAKSFPPQGAGDDNAATGSIHSNLAEDSVDVDTNNADNDSSCTAENILEEGANVVNNITKIESVSLDTNSLIAVTTPSQKTTGIFPCPAADVSSTIDVSSLSKNKAELSLDAAGNQTVLTDVSIGTHLVEDSNDIADNSTVEIHKLSNNFTQAKEPKLNSDEDASCVQSSVTDSVPTKADERKSQMYQNWVHLTESKSVIPPHMPNYTTYKCPACAISFMSEDVLRRHCEDHNRPKKRKISKKKKSKGKKKKSRKTDQSRDDTEITADVSKNKDVKDNKSDTINQNARPVIVSYTESDHDDDEASIGKDNEDENPHVVNNSLWSKHVQLFQEYL